MEIKPHTEVDRNLVELSLLCGEFELEKTEQIKRMFRSSYVALLKGNYTMSELAVAVVFLNNKSLNISKLGGFMGVKTRRAKTVVKRLQDVFNIDLVYSVEEAHEFCNTQGINANELITNIAKHMELTKEVLMSCIYLATDLSYGKVARMFHVSENTVWRHVKKLEEYI
jgi:DNA-binding MarR family transcriptional regulator